MNIRKTRFFKSISILVVFVFICTQAFAGATYEYYPSGRVKAITYSPPENGQTYVEYLDEDWAGLGIGRLYKKVLSSADSDGASSYVYEYLYKAPIVGADTNADGGGKEDLVIDFGAGGLYIYYDAFQWIQITPGDVEECLLGDINGDGDSDVVGTFADGMYLYESSSWTQLTPEVSDGFKIGNIDGDVGGQQDIVAKFSTAGLWQYTNNFVWTQITPGEAYSIDIADIDGDGKDDVICKFSTGLWAYTNNSTWTQITPGNVETLRVGNIDGDIGGQRDIVAKFSTGLWQYTNNSTWTQITPGNPEDFTIADIDGDGKDDVIARFATGLWKYTNNSTWAEVTPAKALAFKVGDIDGDGTEDIIAEFDSGLWKYTNNSTWAQITPANPETFTIVDIDGDGKKDVIAEFNTGLWTYTNNSTWGQITPAGQDNIEKQYGYANTDYTDLVVTKEYDANGTQISKVYNDQYSYWGGEPNLLKRAIKGTNGNVYEYDNEDTFGNGSFGKSLVASSHSTTVLGGTYSTNSSYKAYYWDGGIVDVAEYDGDYSVNIDDAVYSGVYTTQQRVGYTYMHNGDYSLTTAPGTWDMRAKGIYNTNGGGDENIIEAYMWYPGAGYVPGAEDLMKSYNVTGGSGTGTEWDDTLEHKIITQAYYTTTTPLVEGLYTPNDNYSTFTWDPVEVETKGYAGRYEISSEYTTHTDVTAGELRVMYTHEYNGEYTTLYGSSWDIRQKAIYSTDGSTVVEFYSWYDGAGVWGSQNLLLKSYNANEGYYSEWAADNKRILGAVYTTTPTVYEGIYTVTNGYETYDWGYDTGQVLVDMYDGEYSVNAALSAPYSTSVDIVDSELRISYVYDHHNEYEDQSGWTLRAKGLYSTDGETMMEGDTWYESGRLYQENVLSETEKLQYHDKGQGYGGDPDTAWYVEIVWDGDYTIHGHNDTTSDWSASMEWIMLDKEQDDTGIDMMLTAEFTTANGGYIEWLNQYSLNGDTWEYVQSAHYTTGTQPAWYNYPPTSGQYTSRAPNEAFIVPTTIPAKPEIINASGPASLAVNGTLEIEPDTLFHESTSTDDAIFTLFEKIKKLKENSTGEGVLVGLLDSGLDRNKLDANIISGYDFAGSSRSDGLSDTDFSDSTGHGTQTAKVLTETASGVGIIAAKVMDDYGRTNSSIVADAIRYAVEAGSRIIAMPFTLMSVDNVVMDAIDYAVTKNVLLIASAGNEGKEINDKSLAGSKNIITIGSVDNDNKLSAWTNTGEEVDLYAPWDVINNEEGTSFSAAFVAGIAALLLEDDPQLTADGVLLQLKEIFSGVKGNESGEKDQDEEKVMKEVLSKNEVIRKSVDQFTGDNVKFNEVVKY